MPKGKFTATGDFDLGGHHLTDWRYLIDIPQGGATGGQALVWDNDTSSWTPGTVSTTGGLTELPDHTHAVTDLDTPWDDTFRFYTGASTQSAVITVTSDGTNITLTLTGAVGEVTIPFLFNLVPVYVSVPATVALTAGTDPVPVLNYVYILEDGSLNTSSVWPSVVYAPVATVYCQSAASLETYGAYKVHAWTDHIYQSGTGQGHLSDLNFWIRQQQATWVSGCQGSGADGVDTFDVAITAGVALQLHEHTVPAMGTVSTGEELYIVNHDVTPYTRVADLTTTVTDSAGGSMSGRHYNIVMWAVVSEGEDDCKLMINLPGGSYTNSGAAEDDQDSFTNYFIPAAFVGTGFLIAEFQVANAGGSGGTFTINNTTDLRGLLPQITAGGGAGGTTFADDVFRVFDNADTSKVVAFEVSGVDTATTRTLTVPNVNDTMAVTGNFNNFKRFNASFTIDGGGAVVGTGTYGVFELPDTCTLVQITMFADQSGTCNVDIFSGTYGDYPGSLSDISAGSGISVINASKQKVTSFGSWQTAFVQGDVCEITVTQTPSVSNIEWVTLVMSFERSL